MAIRALVFDLDGLIVDTESSDFRSWERAYRDHGLEIPLAAWKAAIGSDGQIFDPLAHLLAQRPEVDPDLLQERRRAYRDALLDALTPLPGVVECVDFAARRGLRMAVASSSSRRWVERHLAQQKLREHFGVLRSADDVTRVKPDPELYRTAAEALGVDPAEAVALEDSPNGVAAARAAGLHCVAVPGPMTRDLDFSAAHLCLDSLGDRPFEEILAYFERG